MKSISSSARTLWVGVPATLLLVGSMLATGCGQATLSAGSQDRLGARLPVRFPPETFDPLEKPTKLRQEYGYPLGACYQRLRWDREGFSWRVQLVDTRNSHAGLLFRRPCDLSGAQSKNWITLKLRPARVAGYLHFGLVDNNLRIGGAHLSRPLSHYHVSTRGDWGTYAVPIGDFFTHVRPGATTFDWTHVVGVQLTRAETDGNPFWVELRDLVFQTETYELERLLASN